MSQRSRQRCEDGFTLIEILVAMTVLLVVLLIANGLLLESVRIFSNSGQELRDPAAELALRLLREDVRAAAPILSPHPQSGPLVCQRLERFESWSVVDGRLERRGYTLDGDDLGARQMIDRVVSFRWWSADWGLVEVEIVRRKPSGASAIRAGTGAWRSSGETLETASIVVGSRLVGW